VMAIVASPYIASMNETRAEGPVLLHQATARASKPSVNAAMPAAAPVIRVPAPVLSGFNQGASDRRIPWPLSPFRHLAMQFMDTH